VWYRQLHWQILLGMAAGVLIGGALGEAVAYIAPLGDIFLRLLRMIIVPLIFSSLVVGTTGLGDATRIGRMGVKALVYYTATSSAAILVGLLAVNVIRPGVGAKLPLTAAPAGVNLSAERLGDTLLGIIPENPLAAMAHGNILAIIFFALVVGLFTNRLPDAGRRIIVDLMQAVFDLMMLITDFIIRLAPIGVLALMATIVGTTGIEAFPPLLRYMLTVALSLAVHALITLPLVLLVFARVWPATYARAVAPALATAFSTASSSATLPVTLESVERRAGVPNQVSAFVLPLGATVNMDGTALYECVAVIFIAQVYGITLGAGQQFLVFVTALLASIGAAGIPMAGLVMMAIVLRAVGLPLEGVGLILAVDRVLDMCRTSVNVWSDTVGAAVIARWEGYTVSAASNKI
jgi:Na+/H+-dicarboxylate symporter